VKVLVFGDLHCPFLHPDAHKFLAHVKERVKPDAVVCTGDELDFHTVSKWPTNPDGLSAGQELKSGIAVMRFFFNLFPRVMVCESNHTIRPFKKAFECGLPSAVMPSYKTIMRAPEGWTWAKRHIIDDVVYIHGEGRSGKYAHMRFMDVYKRSVVIGHIHRHAAVNYEGNFFAMNVGCLINTIPNDELSYAFKYAENNPVQPSLGCGVVVDGKEAVFIRMLVDDNQRWIGP